MIRALNTNDIAACAKLHMKNALLWSHNAQIGEEHIQKIYDVILNAPECDGFGYFNHDQLVCFITTTTNYKETMKKLYSLVSFKYYGKLLKQILRDPNELIDMFEAKFILSRVIEKRGIKPQILTWHNNFEEQNHEIAPLLVMQKALRQLKEKGFSSCTAQVDPKNDRPNIFYANMHAPLIYSSRWNNLYEVNTN